MGLMHTSLVDIIQSYVRLHRPNPRGWRACVHSCDHGRKGPRAAFLLNADGSVAFHCYNCTKVASYDPALHRSIPDKMLEILHDFGIPDEELKKFYIAALGSTLTLNPKVQRPLAPSIEPASIAMPDAFVPLMEADGIMAELGREYLEVERGITPEAYPFYVMPDRSKALKDWYGRLIIPVYKDGRLIYYHGRDMLDSRPKKYLSCSTDATKVMYGFDHVYDRTTTPIFVVEGWFDAYHIDGVATFSNKLTLPQFTWLQRSPRQKIIIPDQYGNGQSLISSGLLYKPNWAVATPSWSCKDINTAILKYGKLFVINEIMANVYTGIVAETAVNLFCKGRTT